MASPKLWAEIWKRPGHATFGKVIADVPVISASGTAPVNGVGEGRITVPKSYERLDEILRSDPATPANAVSSLVRVFSESSSTPIFEFIPAVFTGEQDKADPDIEIVGPAIDVVWGYARLEAWDWTGIDDEHSAWPDWIWGGRNILGDLESAYKPAVTKLYREAGVSAGTFTIGISFDGGAISNTNNIAWNATATAIDTELTAELVAMGFATAQIEVSGSGSEADPWRIQTIIPQGEYLFSVNSGGLTGGLVLQNRESIGALVPDGWTTSFNPVNNLPHGTVEEFRISTFTGSDPAAPPCDTSGFAIMFNGGQDSFPGIQKIVPIKPGGRYYAKATADAEGSGASYRLVIRDLFEGGIAADPGFSTGTTLTASTWTAFSLPAITMPSDKDRVIFRFASVGGGNPPPTFVTCMELREGMPPTTWGDILTQLWLDATSDHAGRRVWQIGAGVTNFLTLDFDASLTSAGNAWADPEVSITLKRGQSYLRVLGEAAKMGYEWRIVPNSVATGTWKLQVYNTGEMGTDQTAVAAGPSIQGGRDVSRRDLRRFLPPATDVAIEAGGQNIARSRNTSAVTALGRIEQYVNAQDLGSLVEAAVTADQSVAVNLSRSQSLSYVLTPTTLDPEPFIAYKAADTLYVLDPPDVPTREARRIKSLGFAFTKDKAEYPVQLESDSYVGVGGIAQSVDFLLKEFKAIREQPADAVDALNFMVPSGGGLDDASWILAASDSTLADVERADQQLTGTADQVTIGAALLANLPAGGIIGFLPGTYYWDDFLTNCDGSGNNTNDLFSQSYVFRGSSGVIFRFAASPASSKYFFRHGDIVAASNDQPEPRLTFENIRFDGGDNDSLLYGTVDGVMQQIGVGAFPNVLYDGCTFRHFGGDYLFNGERHNRYEVKSSLFISCTPTVCFFELGGFSDGNVLIHANQFESCTGALANGSGFHKGGMFWGNQILGGTLTPTGGFLTIFHNRVEDTYYPGDHAGISVDHGTLTGLADDDHPQYRLESADHSHLTTGLQGGLVPGADSTAIHDNVPSEISALTQVTAASGDWVLIEDVSDSNNKKKVVASDFFGSGTDPDAIHDNVAAEISAITEKAVPVGGDWLLIEDSAAADAKKKIQIGNLPGAATFSGARVGKSGNQAITNNTEAVLTWDTEEFDTDTYHDNATNNSRFTIPATGFYLVGASVTTDGAGANRGILYIKVDGTTYVGTMNAGTSNDSPAVSVSTVLSLTAGQFVTAAVNMQTNRNVLADTQTNFWIARIGA